MVNLHLLKDIPNTRHTYAFLNREGHTYIVWADEFEECYLYGIKFFRSDYSECKDQFNVVLNTYDYKNVIATVLEIIVSIFQNQPLASFIFQGENCEGEDEAETQRFRIWSFIAKNTLSSVQFEFKPYYEKSVLLIRNRSCTEPILQIIDNILEQHGVVF